jgi:hypothetical protein
MVTLSRLVFCGRAPRLGEHRPGRLQLVVEATWAEWHNVVLEAG